MKRFFSTLFLLAFFLAGCNLPQPSPPPPTSTPGPSPTPSAVPSPTLLPTQVPTATPAPAARIAAGEKAIFDGDYSKAKQDFQVALASNTDDLIKANAMWGMGQADFLYENLPSALENLRLLTETYPATEYGIRGWFLLGETYYALGRFDEAAAAYQNYLSARPGLLDAYVQEKRGDAFTHLGDYPSAQKSYAAAQQDPGQLNPTGISVSLATSYLNYGDAETALKQFDELYASTTNDYFKAQMDLLSGRALITLGRADEGYDRWRHAVENFPMAYDSYSALLGLVEASQPVDEFNRGLVDYYAGKYDVALAAFERYLPQNPNHDGTVLYYKALAQREMGEYQSAIDTLNILIENYPNNMHWAAAWDDKATIQWYYLDDFNGAGAGLENFAGSVSASPFIVTYLHEAARIYERGGELDKAAQLWESMPGRFGSEPTMGEAWFQAGILRYRLGNHSKANQDFQQALLVAKDPSERARALLWVGKTYASSSDTKNASSAWEQAQIADPNGYYSIRARDLLENRAPFAPPPTMNTKYDLAKERTEAAAWLRIKFTIPPETTLDGPGSLSSDPHFQRGVEFWNVGLYDEARLEFEILRENVKSSPVDSFRLGNYLLDMGMYRPGITAIRQVLSLAGLEDHSASLNAPIYFKHVRYGLYYCDLIWPAAAENAMDPLFITSVIRQESLFEGFVRSSAGARGLMQIIPDTGKSIASQMGWPANYTVDDLYSPIVSIRMGTYYLNSTRRLMNGDLFGMLAGYNGGPGNASIWQELAKGDIDLELEIIRYSESRNYIRGIYETYNTYRSIYSPVQ